MTFKTGSITDANPAQRLYSLIETEAFILGWTLVDSVTIATNTHKVLKSAAVGNSRNLDFYIDINFATTGAGGAFRMGPFEDYNATTHIGFRGPVSGGTGTVEQTFYSKFGATGATLETTSQWTNADNFSGIGLAMTSSPFLYAFSVTRDRIIAFVSNDVAFLYSGFYIPTIDHAAWVGSALFPLVVAKVGLAGTANPNATSSAASMALTRVPKFAAIGAWSSSFTLQPITAVIQGQVGVGISSGTGKIIVSPLVVIFNTSNFNAAGGPGQAFVGTLDGIVNGNILATATRLDTVIIGSDTWYALTPGGLQGTTTSFMRGV